MCGWRSLKVALAVIRIHSVNTMPRGRISSGVHGVIGLVVISVIYFASVFTCINKVVALLMGTKANVALISGRLMRGISSIRDDGLTIRSELRSY